MATHPAATKTHDAKAPAPAEAHLPATTEAPKLPSTDVYDYGEYAGEGQKAAGFEGTTKDDFLIPMLEILQQKSPEVEKETIAGAKAGMFIVKAMGLIFDGKTDGLAIVPIYTHHCFVKWAPRSKGGGIIETYEPDDSIVKAARSKKAFGSIMLDKNNEVVLVGEKEEFDALVETFYLYSNLVMEDQSVMQVCVPFTSTKIGPYKGLMTKASNVLVEIPGIGDKPLRRINPPLFAHRYRLKTFFVEKKGNTWHNYMGINFDGADATEARLDPRGSLYKDGLGFYEGLKSGKLRVDTRNATQDEPIDEGGNRRVNPEDVGDEEVPF